MSSYADNSPSWLDRRRRGCLRRARIRAWAVLPPRLARLRIRQRAASHRRPVRVRNRSVHKSLYIDRSLGSRVAEICCNSRPASMPSSSSQPERPHQALTMQVPANLYLPSPRPYRGLSELDYPLHDWASTVTTCGRICFRRRKVNLSQVFAGQQVGITPGRRAHLARHLHGLRSSATSTTRPAASSRSRIRSARKCYPCLRNELSPM